MGQEASCIAHWRGKTGPVRLHLGSQAFDLKGDIRLSIPRAAIGSPTALGGRLTFNVQGETLRLDLPEAEAARWCAALLKPVPTLAQKLGLGPDCPALLVGTTQDEALLAALEGVRAFSAEQARLVVAMVATVADLEAPAALAGPRALWIVTGKGKHATVRETDLRAWLKQAGFADSKSCAVSETLTATRWQRPKG